MRHEASTQALAAPTRDQTWVQDLAYAINTSCSKMQRVASLWRDRPSIDPMQVVIKLRETAVALHALADRIEGKRNSCLQLTETQNA